jgi:hypothetical protein
MTFARLLPAALLLCSLPAFSQDQQPPTFPLSSSPCSTRSTTGCILKSNLSSSDPNWPVAATPSEPWKIVPDRPSALSSDSTNPIRADQYRFDQGKVDLRTGHSKLEAKNGTVISGLDGQLDPDTTCYAIRSYVVARDSKGSDSTHPAGYSTCRPASRYHVKTAEERRDSRDR